jgi:zinc transport system ATP-binding protein
MDALTPPLLSLSNAGLNKAGNWVVRGVDLSVRAGEIVTLIGPNGSGKSSTLKLALGIEKVSEGTVARKSGLRVGYVPQRLSVDWTMPLRISDFMTLTHLLSGTDIEAALKRTGSPLASRDMRNLSGGEFQRVLLARAIARKPDLLVLDEPVQGVDFTGEIALYELIADLRDELGCGVLMVSHDLHLVMAATDQVICLNGHVCCHGTPERVIGSPQYKSLFGERAAAALAVYQHHHDHRHLADGRVEHADGTISDHCYPGDGHHHALSAGKPNFELKSFTAREKTDA